VIKGVFDEAGDRTVVFGGHEKQAPGFGNPGLEPQHRGCRIRIVILIVERQVFDRELLQREVRRREFDHCVRQFAVEGFTPQAADDGCGLKPAHDVSLTTSGGAIGWSVCDSPVSSLPRIESRPW